MFSHLIHLLFMRRRQRQLFEYLNVKCTRRLALQLFVPRTCLCFCLDVLPTKQLIPQSRMKYLIASDFRQCERATITLLSFLRMSLISWDMGQSANCHEMKWNVSPQSAPFSPHQSISHSN